MKVAVVAGVALLGACASAPPEPLHNPQPLERPPEQVTTPPVAFPPLLSMEARPVITLPPLPPPPAPRGDPSELVRWPLSQATHPALEPAFAIAKVFAQPGVSWIDLCARGVQNRRGGGIAEEHRAYLGAWCDVLRHDAPAAVARLAPLRTTLQRGIADAVRRDIANIVVDAGPSDVAEELLSRAQIDDLAIYDLIAATYAEVGRTSEARYFNGRAIAGSTAGTAGVCERHARDILLAPPDLRRELIGRLRLVTTCRVLADDLTCWNNAKDCAANLGPVETLHELYNAWPTAPREAKTWRNIAYRATLILSVPGADALATFALRAVVEASRCRSRDVRFAIDTAEQLRAAPNHNLNLDPQLDQIIKSPENLCVR